VNEPRSNYASWVLGGTTVRVIDDYRGIWNPSHLDVTLSIISDPNSEYGDEYVEGGLLKFRYQKGSVNGINTKLRRAAWSALATWSKTSKAT